MHAFVLFAFINVFGCGWNDCGGFYYNPPNYVNPFDDRVFILTPPGKASRRPPGDELDYNSAQRKAWIEACRPRLATSHAAFQSCFRELQARNSEAIRRQREEVQNRTEHFHPFGGSSWAR